MLEFQGVQNSNLNSNSFQFDKFQDEHFCRLRRSQLQYLTQNFNTRNHENFNQNQSLNLILPYNLEYACIQQMKNYMFEKSLPKPIFRESVYQFILYYFPSAKQSILIQNGELKVDIQIIQNDKKIAVMPRTQNQYVINIPDQLLNSSISYFKLLQNCGWIVVEVSEQKWKEAGYKQSLIFKNSQVIMLRLTQERH
eukprot:TRINITY_DN519_c2_g1_i1.p2 TRINITY_DN519_c2_g1~~TRINITY_DN519_c2_g1_i1.p2  ORF type:complete len:204 (-),score=14.77 TRINITY_DN519_c2_g1_i1:147-734(-)